VKKHRGNVTSRMKKKSRSPKLKPAQALPEDLEDDGHCVGEINIDDQSVTIHPPPQAGPNVVGITIPGRRRR